MAFEQQKCPIPGKLSQFDLSGNSHKNPYSQGWSFFCLTKILLCEGRPFPKAFHLTMVACGSDTHWSKQED